MKNTSFLAGALLALVPAVALTVPGCGGGNSLLPTPTATSSATSTPTTAGTVIPTTMMTATPTPTGGVTQTSNLTLGNGQRAILTSKVNGTAISGTIQILPSTATPVVKTRAFAFSLTAGTYSYVGTVTAAGAFSINGNFGSFGAFKMSGQLPTATKAGSFTITVNGQTETGVIPIAGQPFPTPVPTSGGGNYNLTSNLTFANVSAGSDVVSTPITSFNSLKDGGTLTNASINGAKYQTLALNGQTGVVSGNGVTRTFSLALFSYASVTSLNVFSIGQVIPLSLQSSQIQLAQSTVQGTAFKFGAWRTTSGTATIKALGTNSATVELNAHFEPTGFAGGVGSFDLKGTVTGTGLEVKTLSN